MKALEAHGLVELAEERLWGGITERFVRRSARHLVVAPDVLHGTAIDPNEVADHLSAAYLIAVNARTVSEVGAIASSAATGTRLPTLTVDAVIGFRSREGRAAFATDRQSAVAALVARYHPWPIADHVEDIPAEMIEWFDAIGVSMAEVYNDLSTVSPIATAFLIESVSGGSCVIRVVTSAHGSGADRENEFFADMVDSFVPILDNLATHFGMAMQRQQR